MQIRGSRVRLRSLSQDDRPLIQQWFNDADVNRHLQFPEFSCCSLLRRFLDRRRDERRDMHFVIEQGRFHWIPVGMCSLHDVSFTKRFAAVSILVGRNTRRQGFASEAYELMLRYSFQKLELDRIVALVQDTNIPSLKFHERLGFELVDVRRDAFRDETGLHSAFLLAIGHDARRMFSAKVSAISG